MSGVTKTSSVVPTILLSESNQVTTNGGGVMGANRIPSLEADQLVLFLPSTGNPMVPFAFSIPIVCAPPSDDIS